MTISEDEAIERARACAEQHGWAWREPVRASLSRAYVVFGRRRYEIWSNAERLGSNASILVDGEDGSIIAAHWRPR